MRVATRINGKMTSVNVRDSVCALHYLLLKDTYRTTTPTDTKTRTKNRIKEHILNACYDITTKWEGDNGKGLSGFIADSMVLDIIDHFKVKQYHKILKNISNFN